MGDSAHNFKVSAKLKQIALDNAFAFSNMLDKAVIKRLNIGWQIGVVKGVYGRNFYATKYFNFIGIFIRKRSNFRQVF